MKKTILCAAILALAGCSTIPRNEGVPARVSEVVERIKLDLKAYQEYDAFAAAANPLENDCRGAVGFYIDSVKVSLTTQTDDTVGGGASATLPVGTGAFGFSFGGSQQKKGTQTLTFSLYPKPVLKKVDLPKTEPAIDAERYPIAANLRLLRNELLEASKIATCMSLVPIYPDGTPTGKDDGGTYAFGFTVINTVTGGASLKLVVFSLGATGTSQRLAGNTITATFKARPGSGAAAIMQ